MVVIVGVSDGFKTFLLAMGGFTFCHWFETWSHCQTTIVLNGFRCTHHRAIGSRPHCIVPFAIGSRPMDSLLCVLDLWTHYRAFQSQPKTSGPFETYGLSTVRFTQPFF